MPAYYYCTIDTMIICIFATWAACNRIPQICRNNYLFTLSGGDDEGCDKMR